MRNNETGEFEVVVGNRQLLSGFFIVVLLFAVAFAMGYVVGQNSPRSSKLETAAATPVPVPEQARPAAAAPVPSTGNAAPDTSPAPPVTEAPAPPPAAPPASDSAPAAADATGNSGGGGSGLAPGTYWQASALPPADAEVIAASLKEKGFPIVLAPAPGARNLTRVLVGPYGDQQSLGKAKTDLENAGFHPLLRK